MINLKNDYCSICHPKILDALYKNQNNLYNGYGYDEHTSNVEKLVKKEIKNEQAKVYILSGGTVTNKVCIGHLLAPHHAVISADSGHIAIHETGAIEETGHKILAVKNENGKITANDIDRICEIHNNEHMVMPKMVYISFPTEFGSLYKLEELKALYNKCQEKGLYLYLDGARLGCALASSNNDITLPDLGKYTDLFYIGGTKNGLLYGEAVVINNERLNEEFKYSIKHFGGLLAKGFISGMMFETLFKDNLFLEIGKKQNELAALLTNELVRIGIKLYSKTETNQIFIIVDSDKISELQEKIMFEIWEEKKQTTVIRFVTHFMLNEKDIYEVVDIIKNII